MGRKRKNNYFTEETENAIIRYNNETNLQIRNMIYTTEIKKPLEKLAEYVINTFKFPYVTESLKNKKVEVVSHIVLNLDKFDHTKGKAFSYFSKAAKTYLILKNNNAYSKVKNHYHIDESYDNDDTTTNSFSGLEDSTIDDNEYNDDMITFVNDITKFFNKNIPIIFSNKRDIKIAYAVAQLMTNYTMIQNFNKKSIYIMLRDMTNESTNHITNILSKMKIIYKDLLNEWATFGTIVGYEYNKKNDWIK